MSKHAVCPLEDAFWDLETLKQLFLSNLFPTSIIQVRFLEQQNKMLETKLELLQGQGVGRSNVEPLFEAYMAGLRRQMDLVNNDKTKLDGELRNMQGLVEDYKHK